MAEIESRNWDITQTTALIRTIFEHKESIFNAEAWTEIVQQLNDNNINRNENQVKGKWKRIRKEYKSGLLKGMSRNLRIK